MSTTSWGAGDYPLMAERLHRVAVKAVDAVGPGPGDRVLDVATGTGNAALLAAGRGAEVIGCDFEPSLLAVAEKRAVELGLHLRWQVADTRDVPVVDGWADAVLSTFGVMYASDHEAAAREMARCTRTGGRCVTASWTPGSFMPLLGRAVERFVAPPPSGSGPPSRWGDAAALEQLLGGAGLTVTDYVTESLPIAFVDLHTATNFLVRTAGNVVAERERLRELGRWDELVEAVEQHVADHSERVRGQLTVNCEYLLASASRE